MPIKRKEIKIRRFWQINPKTKVLESKKGYIRERLKKELTQLIEDAKREIYKNRSTQRKSARKDI